MSKQQLKIRTQALSLAAAATLLGICAAPASAQRTLGLDISTYQGEISQSTWNNIYNVENRKFVVIRSSRGGTTGEDHRQGGYPSGNNTFFSLSQRYDDPYFVQNINRATTAGLIAGSYHFGRHDVSGNTGTDEANHFIQMAGAWMRPGYMLPMYDLEGPALSSSDLQAQYAIDFSNRINAVMGVKPLMYINGVYSTTMQGASLTLRNQLVAAYPNLWDARYAYQSPNYNSPEVQTAHPKDTASSFYGPWDDSGITHPWAFWQYASTGRLQSFNNGGSNLDFDVAQGGIEFVKDRMVPALWLNDSSGQWTTLANWNSGQAPVAPVTGSGQLTPIGTQTLPTPRLPGAAGTAIIDGLNDVVILDRPSANITVTHASGTTNIRKLFMRETLNITGGNFNINYVPVADSTPISAQFSGNVTLSGASTTFSVHTLLVDATRTFTLSGGTLTFNTITLTNGATPAKIVVDGDVNYSPLSNATAVINSTGSGNAASVDLNGATRTFNVGNGSSAVDLRIDVPITNGSLIKTGAGRLSINTVINSTSAIQVDAGALTFEQNFTNTGTFTVASGATTAFNGGTTNLGGVQSWPAGYSLSMSNNLTLNSDAGASGATLNLTQTGGTLSIASKQHLQGLQISTATPVVVTAGGNKTIVTGALTINNGSKLDLSDNNLIVQATAGDHAAKFAQIKSLVQSGFDNFSWTGTGIASTSAAGYAQTDGSRALGVIDNTDWGHGEIEGEPVGPNDIIVKFTYTGDANVDGLVDNDDFGQFLYGFNGGGSPKWLNGDFDYSGVVDNDDFGAFLTGMAAFNASGGTQLSESFKSELAVFATANGIPMLLPEPSALLGAGLCMMLARRRARR